MSCHIKLAPAARHNHIDSGLFAFGKECQFRYIQYIFPPYLGVAAVRHKKFIIETAKDGQVRLACRMAKNAEHLCRQTIFGNTVETIQSGLRRPTDI
ncbi:hypothetical protein Barb7_01568 [Bacteroidales bacterium Barb7]|nr:hypothetical protein Barb7_01568 [Bacteroidales bacterium Barb7]